MIEALAKFSTKLAIKHVNSLKWTEYGLKTLISSNSERDWMNEVCEKINATLPSALSSPYIFLLPYWVILTIASEQWTNVLKSMENKRKVRI